MKSSVLFHSSFNLAVFMVAALILWRPDNAHFRNVHQTQRGVFFSIAKTDRAIIAAGEHGRIFYSRDQGTTWEQAKTPVDITLTSLFFLNNHAGWAAGHAGVILRTTDGGASWECVRKPSPVQPPLFSIWFKDESIGLAIGADSALYRSVDGGMSWAPQKLDIQAHLYSLNETTDGTVWIAGENRTLFSSNDSGETWQRTPTPFPTSFFGTIALSDRLVTFGLRGAVALWNASGPLKHTVECDETLFAGIPLADGRILIAGQRGRLLLGQPDGWTFRSLVMAPQKDIYSLVETSGAIVAAGKFGILRVSKSDLGI